MLYWYDEHVTGEGVDYTSGPYYVTIPAGMTSVRFNIPINDDDIIEHSHQEIFMLTINSLLPTSVMSGNPDQAIVMIRDNDCKLW